MEIIGKGAYGTVRLDRNRPDVAVKTIRYNQGSLIEQTGTLAILSEQHPNLAKVYSIAVVGQDITITMKLYIGDVYNHIIKTQKYLSHEGTIRLEHQIGSALEYLHNHDILHGDVKPDNVLHDLEMNFYLTDFSISMNIQQDKVTGPELLYSLYYRPPVLNYNNQIKGGLILKKEYDYYALFMSLCFVYEGFLIGPKENSLYEIVLSCWRFKQIRFKKLINVTFKEVTYRNIYVKAFDVCF